MKIRVTKTNGTRTTLTSDDTFTLAFPGMIESTPATLAREISRKSLLVIAKSKDDNDASKAEKALSFQK